MKLMDVMAGTVSLSLSQERERFHQVYLFSIVCLISSGWLQSIINFNEFEFSSIFIILYVAK